jgi:secondary thiamine-phosphate synthase enzyme
MVHSLSLSTRQRSEMIEITAEVERLVAESGLDEGRVTVYCPHTTAGVTINEDADPTVRADILETLERLVPWRGGYRHTEGNAAAHIKASLVGHSVTVPIMGGRLALGTWQGIFFCEFDGPRSRRVLVHIG